MFWPPPFWVPAKAVARLTSTAEIETVSDGSPGSSRVLRCWTDVPSISSTTWLDTRGKARVVSTPTGRVTEAVVDPLGMDVVPHWTEIIAGSVNSTTCQ